MKNKIDDLKHSIQSKVADAINDAYEAGQSEELKETKEQLDHALKHAQEAYEFFQVVMNRFCISENHLESTTKSYFFEIGNQLEKIKGIKK